MSDKDKKYCEVPSGDGLYIYGLPWSKKWEFNHHVVPPITASNTFRLDSIERGGQGFLEFAADANQNKETPIYIYDRLDEPSTGMLEQNLSLVEEGRYAFTFACGMAAISANFMAYCQQGDHVLCHQTMYGCTYSFLTNWVGKYGIHHQLVDMTDIDQVVNNINENTRIVYFETPTNPTMEIIDVAKVVEAVEKANKKRPANKRILTLVDNTFATPYLQRPLTMGVDFVIHSLTKNIGGFGTDMGGVVIGKDENLYQDLALYRKDFGGVLSPKSAWEIQVHGLPTLPMRMRRQCDTAIKVARWLERQPGVSKVSYPGLESHPQFEIAKKQMFSPDGQHLGGTLIYFEVKGKDDADAVKNATTFTNWIAENSSRITLAVSLGQPRTLIVAPGAMTHSPIPEEEKKEFGINAAGVRLSIGLEEPENLIDELEEAFRQI